MRREKDIQLSILHYLKNIGATAGKVKVGGQIGKGRFRYKDFWTFRGYPDICVFFNKRMWYIEVKSEKGVLSSFQKNFQLLCRDAGIPYIVARDLETVANVIK